MYTATPTQAMAFGGMPATWTVRSVQSKPIILGHGMTMVTYAELNAAIQQAKLGVAATELHGSITGYLCAGWGGRAHELLMALALESDDAAAVDDLHALVDRLVADLAGKLRAREAVVPLLPEAALVLRADAMVDWCRGFLGGIGLTGVAPGPGHVAEVNALLADFGHIASMHLECHDDDEESLDDVLDFIGTGVARLHAVLAPAGMQ